MKTRDVARRLQPLLKDDLRWKDDLWPKTMFDQTRPLTEDDLLQKTTIDGERPLSEEDLWRKTIFDRRRPLIGCLVYYLKKMFTTPHHDSHNTTDPKPEILSAVKTGKRISCDGRNVRGIAHAHVCRKDDISRQRRLNIHHVLCIVYHASCIMNHASCIKKINTPLKEIM